MATLSSRREVQLGHAQAPGRPLIRAELYRDYPTAAEAEGGMPISAGARVAHLPMAVESGRMFYVDLSGVPDDERPGVVAEIKALVERASLRAAGDNPKPSRTTAEVNS
jgi:hypothetical protein